MLIFDKFASVAKAKEFADCVRRKFGRATYVCLSRDDAEKVDAPFGLGFPFELHPPIVLIERDDKDNDEERQIEAMVKEYGGSFAGT